MRENLFNFGWVGMTQEYWGETDGSGWPSQFIELGYVCLVPHIIIASYNNKEIFHPNPTLVVLFWAIRYDDTR